MDKTTEAAILHFGKVDGNVNHFKFAEISYGNDYAPNTATVERTNSGRPEQRL